MLWDSSRAEAAADFMVKHGQRLNAGILHCVQDDDVKDPRNYVELVPDEDVNEQRFREGFDGGCSRAGVANACCG